MAERHFDGLPEDSISVGGLAADLGLLGPRSDLLALADALAAAVRAWRDNTLDHGCGFDIRDHISRCIEPKIQTMLDAERVYTAAREGR